MKTFTEALDKLRIACRNFRREFILSIRLLFIFNKDAGKVIRDQQAEIDRLRDALNDLTMFNHFPMSKNPKYQRALTKGLNALHGKQSNE